MLYSSIQLIVYYRYLIQFYRANNILENLIQFYTANNVNILEIFNTVLYS